MPEITLDSFKETLSALIDANAHAKTKGDKFKKWIKDNFKCEARISYITSQQQLTNRVSEQFRYFDPIVVFVCVSDVKRDRLREYILERCYDKLENVAIVGVTKDNGTKTYTFEHLFKFKSSEFSRWAEPHFENVESPDVSREQSDLPDGDSATSVVDESIRTNGGLNILLYGVPGSGKSWTIEHEYCKPDTIVERLVFHPDYTNADFVGQILPVVDPIDKQVTYEFTPGPFTNILKEAYNHPEQRYILIIEEINRGNAPAIFGDVFQLLDRTAVPKTVDGITYPAGTSEYGITNGNVAGIVYGDKERKVRIPSNLSILGTMNTSDQNVFTLDTAFQRRWRMRLIENNFNNVRDSLSNATILDTGVTWRHFCETVNALIVGSKARMASAEDKRLGVYFVHESDLALDTRANPREGFATLQEEFDDLVRKELCVIITNDESTRLKIIRDAVMQNRVFPEKVIKYLWDDAFKFNVEGLFDTDNMDSLEKVIHTFVYNTGRDRFKVFKTSVQQKLYPNQ